MTKKTLNSILIILCVLSICCANNQKVSRESLLGKYQWHGSYAASNITLKPDSSFIFHWTAGLLGGTTKGTWNLSGKNIILNSELQPSKKNRDFIVETMNECVSTEIKILIKDANNEPIPFANCKVISDNTELNGKTDFEGKVKFDIRQVDKIIIEYVGKKTVEFKNKDKSLNNFVFIMKSERNDYRFFTNEKWKIKNNRLYDKNIRKDKWTNNYYEKVKK